MSDRKEIMTACALTGYRPKRFSFGNDKNDSACVKLKLALSKHISALTNEGVTNFFSGMALGVEQWAAECILRIRAVRRGLTLTAVIPFEGQADNWTAKQRDRYYDLHPKCDDVIMLKTRYTPACIFERNKFLVDHAGYLIAVYDGYGRGGTAYMVRYARKKGRRIIIIHPDTLAVTWEGF